MPNTTSATMAVTVTIGRRIAKSEMNISASRPLGSPVSWRPPRLPAPSPAARYLLRLLPRLFPPGCWLHLEHPGAPASALLAPPAPRAARARCLAGLPHRLGL